MLARLEMKLEKADGMSYQMSSSFHGALMELFQGNMAKSFIYQNYIHIHNI